MAPTAKDRSVSELKSLYKFGGSVALICAAQGYPTPLYR